MDLIWKKLEKIESDIKTLTFKVNCILLVIALWGIVIMIESC